MLEFTFCMIILFLMMYRIIMVFRWVGLDLGQRQKAHEALLTSPIDPNYGRCTTWVLGVCTSYVNEVTGPLTQIDPHFSTPAPMNAVWSGD